MVTAHPFQLTPPQWGCVGKSMARAKESDGAKGLKHHPLGMQPLQMPQMHSPMGAHPMVRDPRPVCPQWAAVGTWGHNPMAPWPQLAHQSQHAAAGGNWVPHWWPRPGFGAAQPPPCSQIQWAPQLVAPNGLATLMAMAQGCAHGLCTSHTMHSVPLGTCVLLEIEKSHIKNRDILADF